MRRDDIIVRHPVIFELVCADRPSVPAQVELRYARRDPYAVALAFPSDGVREVVWRFCRELLARGLVEAVGDGDVRLRPLDPLVARGSVEIELRSPAGRAVFRAPHADLRGFLARSHDLVAPGAERDWLDLDHTVAMLRLAPGDGPGRYRSVR